MHSIDPDPKTHPPRRARWAFLALTALGIMAIAACGGGGSDEGGGAPAGGAPAGGAPAGGAAVIVDHPVVVRMESLKKFNQPGVALFTPMGAQTEVDVRATAFQLGWVQPLTIDGPTCDDFKDEPDDADFRLEDILNGLSTTVVDAPISDLVNGTHTIHIRQEPNLPFIATSCGLLLPGEARTVNMNEVGGSAQSGFASIVRAGAETQVNLHLAVLPEWQKQFSGDAAAAPQPANIYSGTCDALGDVVYPLDDVFARDAWGTTVIPASFDDLAGGAFAIAVLHNADDPTVMACGNLNGSDDA